MVLRIAFFANPFLSKTSALPYGFFKNAAKAKRRSQPSTCKHFFGRAKTKRPGAQPRGADSYGFVVPNVKVAN
jgi:hypothetical protein